MRSKKKIAEAMAVTRTVFGKVKTARRDGAMKKSSEGLLRCPWRWVETVNWHAGQGEGVE